MKVKIKLHKTQEIREVEPHLWEAMKKDGRSRFYSVVPQQEDKPVVKTKKEKIEIKPIEELYEGTN
jgi:hypothetical protein